VKKEEVDEAPPLTVMRDDDDEFTRYLWMLWEDRHL
jgi:hypothetical protein